jgi:hypothetical protein
MRKASPANLPPLRQGDLDGACGLYAIANAVRNALPADLDHEKLCIGVFKTMLRELEREKCLAEAVVEGVMTQAISRLLKVASLYLAHRHKLELTVVRPFVNIGSLELSEYMDVLAHHLAKPGTSVIIGLDEPEDHWSVVRGLTKKEMLMVDSYGRRAFKLRKLRVTSKKRIDGKVHIPPACTFLTRLTD